MKKTIVFLLVVMLLTGCAVQQEKEIVTLKVLYNSTDEFMTKYGKMYLAKNENIDFEIIPLDPYFKEGLSYEQYLEIVESTNPDIIYGFDYEIFVNEGKLLNLDSYLQKSKDFRLDQINSNLLDYLQQKGNGSIYALSPTFTGKATYYNISLLDQLGIEYPTDGMNWSEVLELSSRISEASDIVGNEMISFYYNSNLFGLATKIADTMGLQYVNESGAVTFNTEGWKYIVDLVVESARNGEVTTRDNSSNSDPLGLFEFSKGNVALTVEYSYLLDDLQNVDFEWGVVTVPTDSSLESFDALIPNALFGVNRDSSHIEESVDFIKYINGEKFAQLEQKSRILSSLPARESFSNQIVDVNLDAFYKVKPLTFVRELPFSLEQATQLYEEANAILKNAVANETNIEDILTSLQDTTEAIIMSK